MNGDSRDESMRIVLDVPDSIIPDEIKALLDSGTSTEKQHKQIIEAFFKLALDEIEICSVVLQNPGMRE